MSKIGRKQGVVRNIYYVEANKQWRIHKVCLWLNNLYSQREGKVFSTTKLADFFALYCNFTKIEVREDVATNHNTKLILLKIIIINAILL